MSELREYKVQQDFKELRAMLVPLDQSEQWDYRESRVTLAQQALKAQQVMSGQQEHKGQQDFKELQAPKVLPGTSVQQDYRA